MAEQEQPNNQSIPTHLSDKKYEAQLHPDIRITQKHVDNVVKAIDISLSGRPLSALNILRVSIMAMSITADMFDLPNNVKKMVLIAALNQCISKQCDANMFTEAEKEVLLTIIDSTVSNVIDIVHDVATGKINILPKECCSCDSCNVCDSCIIS